MSELLLAIGAVSLLAFLSRRRPLWTVQADDLEPEYPGGSDETLYGDFQNAQNIQNQAPGSGENQPANDVSGAAESPAAKQDLIPGQDAAVQSPYQLAVKALPYIE